jgi:hypothetical protein
MSKEVNLALTRTSTVVAFAPSLCVCPKFRAVIKGLVYTLVFNNTPAVVSVVIFVPLTVNVVISLVAARLIVVIDTHTPVTVSVLAIAEAVKFNVDNLSACWNSKSDACDSSVKVFTVPQLPSDEVAVKLFTVTTGPPGPFAGPALRVIVETPIALVVNLGAKNVDTVVLVKIS